MTFVKTKLLVERMRVGGIAEVRLKGAEPLQNVPRSLRELGHLVLEITPEAVWEGSARRQCGPPE